METVLIGSGNVAWALARALTDSGNPPLQIFARNRQKAAEIASMCGCSFTDKKEELASAELYIIAVTDREIASVASSLDFGEATVAHTAGSVALEALPDSITNRAVIYPLQTFVKGRAVDFSQVPFFIEGSTPKAAECAAAFARALSRNVIEANTEQRSRIHLAAVFACNFVNHMYVVGELLAQEGGFDFSTLKPLIMETALRACESSSPTKTQTGPAVRNDFQTKSRHCEMLISKPELRNLYVNISNDIWETSKKISRE